jgi:hypothetical protein
MIKTKVFRTVAVIGFCLISYSANAQIKESKNLAPGFDSIPAQAKIVLMPIDVELFSMSAGGVLEPKADWTAAAQKFMLEAIRKKKTGLGLQFSEISEKDADGYEELSSLHAAVASSISIHHFGPLPLPTKAGKLDWSLGSAVDELRAKTNADYGLFVWVRDSYASAERKAMMVGLALLGVGVTGGIQVGYASLIDLKDGKIVWFNRLVRGRGDLRELAPATDSVTDLLSDFPKIR